jgi:hypothetical protein
MAAIDGKLLAMTETTATVAVWMPFAAMVLSPSGNVYCGLGQAEDQSGAMGGWGDRISMRQGGAPQMSCHTDTLKDPGSPVLEYGQTRSLNSLMCDSETSGMTCMDDGTGHYFRLARDNYELH